MANEKNLEKGKATQFRTGEEQARIAKIGGIASGAARRRKKSMREAADLFLSLPVSDQKLWNKLAKAGVNPEDIDNQMAMVAGLTLAGAKGDSRAAKIIIDVLDEKHDEDKFDKLDTLLEEFKNAIESEAD